MKKLSFYTFPGGVGWIGRCDQDATLEATRKTRDATYSAVKRLAKKQGVLKMITKPITKKIAKAAKPVLKNRIAIVIDESSSMGGLRYKLVEELNRTFATIRAEAAASGQETTVSIYKFSDRVVRKFSGVFAADLQDWTRNDYSPNNMTALLDGVGQAIMDLQSYPDQDSKDVSHLIIVLTDGEENASQRFSQLRLTQLMATVQKTDRWSFAFQVPRGSRQVALHLGVPDGNIQEWTAGSAVELATTSAATNRGTQSFYAARSAGRSSVQNFYTTDLSGLQVGTLKKAMMNLDGQVRTATVTKEEDIRTFCEKNFGKPLLKGAAFYQLTKSEKNIQDYKKLLVMEKGKRNIYGGDNARQVLGFPLTGDVKVVPGNHANFEIFVQSTSTNRKLVRGTKVVYWAAIGVPYTEGPSAPATTGARARRIR